jgi:hypothetical protein
MNLATLQPGQDVEVLINNIRTNKDEWRKGVVQEVKNIHPNRGERFTPYPMALIKTIRTYWKGDSFGNGEFYDKENIEGFLNNSDVKSV